MDIDINESNNTIMNKLMHKSNSKMWSGMLVAVILVIGLFSTSILLKNQLELRQRADTNLNACGQPGGFCETFDGAPTSPLNLGGIAGKYVFPNWQFAVHSRDQSTWQTLETQDNVMHGADCSAPPAMHSNNTYEGAVFNCKNHVMTAMLAGGYGLISMTPNAMVDFSNGPAIIQWEMSTDRMSKRDWPDVWITPWNDATLLPYDAGPVDMQGPAKNAVSVTAQAGQNSWAGNIYQDGVTTSVSTQWWVPMSDGIVDGTNQDAVRQTFRITISANHIKMERLPSTTAPNGLVWFDQDVPNLNFNKGVVQFSHHIYNPFKDNSGVSATWHWDTIAINPSIPFTIIHADKRNVSADGEVVTFDSPAPADSLLKFAGAGGITYSLNNDAYQTAPKQLYAGHPEHFSPYSIPVPEGTQNVSFKFGPDDWYNCGWGCQAEDFSIWSLTPPAGTPISPTATIAPGQPTPTTIPTSIPLPTAIPTVIPTAIPTSIPTKIPVPTISSNDTISPISSITNPLAGAFVSVRSTINIQATASDNVGVVRTEFYVNGTLTCSDTSSPYSCAWKVPGAKNKRYTISAKAYDAAGNNSTASISVTSK